ncbi:hypothetical protein C1645_737952 [Glomus cerebriforme]|uniref:Uncharacterized protein n=1 Tax=Glomus cerebriforme TaxID=658196 RepID=A0A397SVS8_9GLOM|nr:hypothetical protein C1645_737952 [Glomus cerebriforme]
MYLTLFKKRLSKQQLRIIKYRRDFGKLVKMIIHRIEKHKRNEFSYCLNYNAEINNFSSTIFCLFCKTKIISSEELDYDEMDEKSITAYFLFFVEKMHHRLENDLKNEFIKASQSSILLPISTVKFFANNTKIPRKSKKKKPVKKRRLNKN